MKALNAGILGATGYTGGELIRLLLNHPTINLMYVHSTAQSGKPVHEVHADLVGQTELRFSDTYQFEGLDVLFLCLPHGQTTKVYHQILHQLPINLILIDLSNDFRLKGEHPFVYGLPELQADTIRQAKRIANPGCFATAIQLSLLPLAQAGMISSELHVHGITGSTGAGRALSESVHFSWRTNNIQVYKAFSHQHLAEIRESLQSLQNGTIPDLNFIPIRGNFTRGILVSVYTKCSLTLTEAYALYEKVYNTHPFSHVVANNPDLKQVVGTNNALIYLEKHGSNLMITTVIDNLLKGASGQAVENMNLAAGFERTAGLKLKAIAF